MNKDKIDFDNIDLSISVLSDTASMKEMLETIYTKFRKQEDEIKYLREELEKTKDEAYKDKELEAMHKMYKEMHADYYRGFPISKEEKEKIDAWINEQCKKKKVNTGAIGGRFRYEFYPTSIGTTGVVIDTATEEKFVFQELS